MQQNLNEGKLILHLIVHGFSPAAEVMLLEKRSFSSAKHRRGILKKRGSRHTFHTATIIIKGFYVLCYTLCTSLFRFLKS